MDFPEQSINSAIADGLLKESAAIPSGRFLDVWDLVLKGRAVSHLSQATEVAQSQPVDAAVDNALRRALQRNPKLMAELQEAIRAELSCANSANDDA